MSLGTIISLKVTQCHLKLLRFWREVGNTKMETIGIRQARLKMSKRLKWGMRTIYWRESVVRSLSNFHTSSVWALPLLTTKTLKRSLLIPMHPIHTSMDLRNSTHPVRLLWLLTQETFHLKGHPTQPPKGLTLPKLRWPNSYKPLFCMWRADLPRWRPITSQIQLTKAQWSPNTSIKCCRQGLPFIPRNHWGVQWI
jgi:hypothetical protein